jgi:hypothetical protein
VIESLLHDYPSGNERRLSEVQNAISAIDEAVRDEIDLALSAVPGWSAESEDFARVSAGADRVRQDLPTSRSGSSVGHSVSPRQHAWPSYEAWRSGRKTGPQEEHGRDAASPEPQSDHARILALWRSWGAPAQLTEQQIDAMLRR